MKRQAFEWNCWNDLTNLGLIEFLLFTADISEASSPKNNQIRGCDGSVSWNGCQHVEGHSCGQYFLRLLREGQNHAGHIGCPSVCNASFRPCLLPIYFMAALLKIHCL